MKNKSYMTISEFAHITGIKRANLIFYDNIGLLKPELRKENNYRCYTRQQLDSAYLITALRDLGLGLEEIRNYADERTPDKLLLLLAQQKKQIQNEINRLYQLQDMMGLYTKMAKEGMEWNTEEIILREQEREPIFLGAPTDLLRTNDENAIAFYEDAASQGIVLAYPLGCIFSKELLTKEPITPSDTPKEDTEDNTEDKISRFYFKVKRGQNAYKPKGLYAVACGYCSYGKSFFLYDKLIQYIDSHGLYICGNAYEESPLNEMAVKKDEHYLIKVEIRVAYKG